MARIGIFGAGYVGIVSGAGFAELGHTVVLCDIVRERIDRLKAGDAPIYEPGLDEVLESNRGRMTFTMEAAEAAACDFVFVCVCTPSSYSVYADLTAVWPVLGGHANGEGAVVVEQCVYVQGSG